MGQDPQGWVKTPKDGSRPQTAIESEGAGRRRERDVAKRKGGAWKTHVEEPALELVVTFQQFSEPEAERGGLPGDVAPQFRHARVVHGVHGVAQRRRHDDDALDGQLQVLQH